MARRKLPRSKPGDRRISADALLRPAHDDASFQRLSELAREIWTEHYTPLIGAEQVAYMLENLQSAGRIAEDTRSGKLIYEELIMDGIPIGYLAWRIEAEAAACFLSKIYVRRQDRGQGLARLMIADLEARARQAGARSMYLTVNRGNQTAIRAYEHIGFIRERRAVVEIGGGFVMDDYIMRLTFDEPTRDGILVKDL